MRFYQIFWVLLPMAVYGLFWSFWSSWLERPVPVVGKFLWNSGLALKKIMPNLQNPHDQFIYFPEASRWWDVAMAPFGALVLVLLYYNRRFNDEMLAYEDINFSVRKLLGDVFFPISRPLNYAIDWWREKRRNYYFKAYLKLLGKEIRTNKDLQEFERVKNIYQVESERILAQLEGSHMEYYENLMGIKSWMAYCVTIGFVVGVFIGILLGPMKGPFGFFGFKVLLGAIMAPLMILVSHRVQKVVIVHVASWVGLWYGLSIGIGMIPALVWTSYMYVPTGFFIAAVYLFRSRRKMETGLAL